MCRNCPVESKYDEFIFSTCIAQPASPLRKNQACFSRPSCRRCEFHHPWYQCTLLSIGSNGRKAFIHSGRLRQGWGWGAAGWEGLELGGSDNRERVKVCKLLLVFSETKQIYTAVWDDSNDELSY